MITGSLIFDGLGALVPFAKLRAERIVWDGRAGPRGMRIIRDCTHRVRLSRDLGASIVFTKEKGYHSGGWWKNPDYERCFHLSIGFLEAPFAFPQPNSVPFQKSEGETIARAFFGDDVKLSWFEPPYSEKGKLLGVGHYRLFCDRGWQPFKPRGEVYNTDWTPEGWQSFSDLHASVGGER